MLTSALEMHGNSDVPPAHIVLLGSARIVVTGYESFSVRTHGSPIPGRGCAAADV